MVVGAGFCIGKIIFGSSMQKVHTDVFAKGKILCLHFFV